ncbi:MAG: hypothetical protein OXH72_16415 [Caldilineaceae bacterium]|nr:hypothetical protein [Caldilineaceae bacterium]
MTGSMVLLVEGRDDQRVVDRICREHGVPCPNVEYRGSDADLLQEFSTQLKVLGKEDAEDVLGVVIDADTSATNRWQSLRDRLGNAGYQEIPRQPEPGGTIVSPAAEELSPKVGIWIMPNNQDSGELEDFLAFLVPDSDSHWQHAESCVDSLNQPLFRPVDRSKAIIHTWLAWQADPGLPFGTAIQSRFLDPNAPHARQLVHWLRELFG